MIKKASFSTIKYCDLSQKLHDKVNSQPHLVKKLWSMKNKYGGPVTEATLNPFGLFFLVIFLLLVMSETVKELEVALLYSWK
jgi:hypothetical protein